jgi:hypothetical protein
MLASLHTDFLLSGDWSSIWFQLYFSTSWVLSEIPHHFLVIDNVGQNLKCDVFLYKYKVRKIQFLTSLCPHTTIGVNMFDTVFNIRVLHI